MRKEGFKLQPVSHRVHWHLHQDPPSYSRCFSAILSLLSIPETYSSSYICCRMKPFTVFRVAKDKKKKTREANWIECAEFEWCMRDSLQPRMSSKFFYIVCIRIEELTRGEGKMTCEKWFIWAVNVSSSPHSNLVATVPIPSRCKADLGHNQPKQLRHSRWKHGDTADGPEIVVGLKDATKLA